MDSVQPKSNTRDGPVWFRCLMALDAPSGRAINNFRTRIPRQGWIATGKQRIGLYRISLEARQSGSAAAFSSAVWVNNPVRPAPE